MSALAPTLATAALSVQTVRDRAGFQALESEWNALVTAYNDELWLRHEFLSVWLDSFGPGGDLHILTARSAEGRLVAVLPLVAQPGVIRGIPVRQLVSMANSHSCRSDMVAEDPAAAGRASFGHLSRERDWDVLRILDV